MLGGSTSQRTRPAVSFHDMPRLRRSLELPAGIQQHFPDAQATQQSKSRAMAFGRRLLPAPSA